MATRLVEQDRQVIVPRCWQRGCNALTPVPEPRVPEPAQLYSLIVLALVLHVARLRSGRCEDCGALWPCAPVLLAFRLREGF